MKRLRTCGLSIALALGACGAARAREQQPVPSQPAEPSQPAPEESARQDEGIAVRGAFVTSRPGAKREEKRVAGGQARPTAAGGGAKSAKNAPASGGRRQQARPGGGAAKSAGAQAAEWKGAGQQQRPGALAGGVQLEQAAHAPAGLGIGYTLFMRGETGAAVRVSSAREFRSGESVRLVLETNADVYLYIFNEENGAAPRMIYPDGRLDRGANFIRAHVPHEIPSSRGADDSTRWFVFDDRPALERLFIVVSRRPLEGVPTGEELVGLCAEPATCVWSPKPEHWAVLRRANEREQIAVSQTRDDGRMQTAAEREAVTRGIGLASDAPLPSVIHMVSSSNAEVLVATLDLVHR